MRSILTFRAAILTVALCSLGSFSAFGQDPCTDPNMIPTWDGSIINNGDGTGLLLNVLAPAGFDQVVLEDSLTYNLTMLKPKDTTDAPIAAFSPTGTSVAPFDSNLGEGNHAWTYSDTLNRPTSIRIPIASQFVGSSRGVFDFVDICGRASRYDIVDGVLAVELASFSVVLDGNDAVVKWQTASELDNQGFEVQEAAGAQAYQTLGFVEGAGTSTYSRSYQYVARNLAPGPHRFRLKQIEFSGAITYSPEVEVNADLTGDFVLSPAYPNPFSALASFTLGVRQSQRVRLEVFDMLGRRVAHLFDGVIPAGTTQAFSLDGSSLPGGTYIYRVTGETFSQSRSATIIK